MAAQYTVSGSEFWSIYTSRYPIKAETHQPECVLVDGVFKYKTANGRPDALEPKPEQSINGEPISTSAINGVDLKDTNDASDSTNYVFVNTFADLSNLHSPTASAIFVDELQNILCGQAFDLHWKYHTHCPTVDEYMMMIYNKTGALFRLCVRLMQAESAVPCQNINTCRFVTPLGRNIQIRDDYQNLTADEYTKTKGFCEDLDEGKISLPLIYTLQKPGAYQAAIRGIFQNKATGEGLALEMKEWILTHMQETGALEYTLTMLREMQDELLDGLSSLEEKFGSKNLILKLILLKLWL